MGTAAVGLKLKVVGDDVAAAALTALEKRAREASRTTASTMAKVSAAAVDAHGKVGGAARQVASAVETIARSGQASGEALKQIATQAGEMAFMFGPQGAIAGAIAVTGVAIYGFFNRVRREMEETRKKAQEETARLLNAGDYRGLMGRLRDLEIGTPGASYADGINARKARIADLTDRLNRTWNPIELANLRAALKRAREELEPLLAEQARLTALILNPPAAPPEIRGLPAVISRASANGSRGRAVTTTKPTPATPGRPDFSGVAAQVGGVLAAGADAQVRNVLSGIGLTNGQLEATISKAIDAGRKAVEESTEELKRAAEAATKELADSLATQFQEALVGAFRRGFDTRSLSGFIQGFGRSVLAMLGELFIMIGKKLIDFGAIATAVAEAIKSLGIFAGPAALAAGVALIALGAGMGALAGGGGGGGRGGGGGGGYAGSSGQQVIDRGYINPLNPLAQDGSLKIGTRSPVVNHVTVIGPNDAQAQRQIAELLRNGAERGYQPWRK